MLESALCLWIQVHPMWIQGLKRLVLWIQNQTLLEDQGLWIQAIVLHYSCAKAASQTVEDEKQSLHCASALAKFYEVFSNLQSSFYCLG